MNLNQVTVPSIDIQKSKIFYLDIGLRLIVDTDHYIRFECPDGDSTFSVHLVESLPKGKGIVIYFECSDLDERIKELVQQGLQFEHLPTDKSWLWREASLQDPDGNQIILYHAGENRKNPPWRVGQ